MRFARLKSLPALYGMVWAVVCTQCVPQVLCCSVFLSQCVAVCLSLSVLQCVSFSVCCSVCLSLWAAV